MTRSRQTIKAGEYGTKKYVNEYGKNLVNVRYYYDIKKKRKITTVELIMWEKEWIPKKINPRKLVKLRIERKERELQKRVKNNGGKWDEDKKVWIIPFGKVREMQLERRIVGI
jgi:hypothetical protein